MTLTERVVRTRGLRQLRHGTRPCRINQVRGVESAVVAPILPLGKGILLLRHGDSSRFVELRAAQPGVYRAPASRAPPRAKRSAPGRPPGDLGALTEDRRSLRVRDTKLTGLGDDLVGERENFQNFTGRPVAFGPFRC